MPSKNKIIGAILIFLTLILLILINMDLFSFTQDFPIKRDFLIESDEQGNHTITPLLILKRGLYQISFHGKNEDKHNGYILYVNGESVNTDTFDTGEINYTINLPIEAKTANVQIGVYYSRTPALFYIEHLTIHSDHVLTKESVFRHAIISLLLLLVSTFFFLQFCYSSFFIKFVHNRVTIQNEAIVLFIIGISFLSSIPILNSGFPQSTDLFYHLMRIEGIKDSVLAGHFPARIHLFALKDYGYGSGFFYPDFFLYFPALLRILGFSILTSWKIFTFLNSFTAIFIMYLFVHSISKSIRAGIISATFYAFAAYRLLSIYYRGAIGETQSYMFMPLILWGLYEILYDQTDHWMRFAIGFTGLILCHSISLALNGIFVLLILFLYCKRLIKNPRIFLSLGKAFLTAMGLSSYFWLPLIEQLQSNQIKAGFLYTNASVPLYHHHVLDFSSLFRFFSKWSNIYQNVYFGYPLLLIPFFFLLILFIYRGKICSSKLNKFAFALLFTGVIFLLAGTKVFPWQYFSYLQSKINYLWRGFMISTCCFSIVGGLSCLPLLKRARGNFVLPLVLISCLAGISPMFIDLYKNNTYPGSLFQLNDNWILGEEWLPIHADKNFVDKNGNNVLMNGKILEDCVFDRNGLSFTFSFTSENNKVNTFEVPLLYYAGYQAVLSTPDGQNTELRTSQGPYGLVHFSVSGTPSGKIHVWYQKTSVQWISEFISIFTLIIIIIIHQKSAQRKMISAKSDAFIHYS